MTLSTVELPLSYKEVCIELSIEGIQKLSYKYLMHLIVEF